MLLMSANGRNKFQSTLPVRGATEGYREGPAVFCISIHAPREGSDSSAIAGYPAGIISIHAPREGSDGRARPSGRRFRDFNPRSP